MFGFLSPAAKDLHDPLATPKTVSAWLRELPSLDLIGRQQSVMLAFEELRRARKPIDPQRVAAIQLLDTALAADRRQLIKQYAENVSSSQRLAERIWQAVFELCQGFIAVYQLTLEQALAQLGNPRWKPFVPPLFARLIHFYGTDAKLRVFRFERWIPAKWMEVNRLYMRAAELAIDRVPTMLSSGPRSTPWTVEQEYVLVLLLHQLNTGNLTPAEIDWASAQIRAWTRKLTLEAIARSSEGFVVDVAGKSGLARRTGGESGSMLRYLDTTPLVEQLESALAALRESEATDQGPSASLNQQRISILERVRPAVAPNMQSELRRDPRHSVSAAARVRVGLARICNDLSSKDINDIAPDPSAPTEHIEVYAVSDGPRSRRRPAEEQDTFSESIVGFADPLWQVKDRSVAGLRVAASGGIGASLALGALVAVRQANSIEWVLGVVRRLNKLTTGDVEAGVSIIAERVVAVVLESRRDPRPDNTGIVVEGDATTAGARFDALYLPPPSRPDKPLGVKTVIVPTSEYAEGRQVMLATGRSAYTIAMRNLIEQRAEWSWVAIQIVSKKAL